MVALKNKKNSKTSKKSFLIFGEQKYYPKIESKLKNFNFLNVFDVF